MSGTGPSAAATVSLRGLQKRFDGHVALHALDLDVAAGEFLVLVGPSGCGKTTVLRLIAGLEAPTAGAVRIGERDVAGLEPAERDVAMVFKNYALYPHMTVRENLAFGLRMRRAPAPMVAERVGWAAGVLGLTPLLDRRPGQLSGGEKQRVAFGRAMVREPQVFLFDEPLSNLDARLRADMRREIADLHARLGATMIYVTHDQVEAMTLGQRIAVMRDGRLEQVASPLEVYRRPATLFVAGFIGTPAINLAEGVVGAGAWRAGPLAVPVGDGVRDGPAVLGVRPEDLRLHLARDPGADPMSAAPSRDAAFATVVRRVEVLGNESLVHVDGPGGDPWVARAAAGWHHPPGTRLECGLDPTRVHLFDRATGMRLDVASARAHP